MFRRFCNFVVMNNFPSPRPLELLAPARSADVAIAAIRHGADAVYMGGPSHGARQSASNSIEDIRRVCDYAHQFGARVYTTLNTLVYDDEIPAVERLVGELYRAGVDVLIVQDMSLLRMQIPPIELHASTQCDIRSAAKARFLADVGFSQLVVAREMSIDEMREISSAVDVPVEAFVHGALCVSYSGDCQAGFASAGRSANRGECPQVCRHRFDLVDDRGNVLVRDKHLLSLRDLNRSELLQQLVDAGVSSFKIEGRLKDEAYVKNVTAYYRRELDRIIAANPDRYCRASYGRSKISFTPDLHKSFNRGFTTYFSTDENPRRIASVDTPKWRGQEVGRVVKCDGRRLTADLSAEIHNGDGLVWFDRRGEFCGQRINRAEGSSLYPAQSVDVRPGTILYRNRDTEFDRQLEGQTAERRISVDIVLRTCSFGVALDLCDEAGNHASVALETQLEPARSPQDEQRRRQLSRLGDTVYSLGNLTDSVGQLFIPNSLLADLRRRGIEALQRVSRLAWRQPRRRQENRDARLEGPTSLTYHDNVANRLAREFYRDHGATEIQPALEADASVRPDVVMTTRYCLRREFGQCLLGKTPRPADSKPWPRNLALRSGALLYPLSFDCRACRMHLLAPVKEGNP